jgi:hypothetical protein
MNLSELTVAGTSKMGYLPNAFTIENRWDEFYMPLWHNGG